MGLAWRREEGREVILVVGFRTLLDAFWKEPKKKKKRAPTKCEGKPGVRDEDLLSDAVRAWNLWLSEPSCI